MRRTLVPFVALVTLLALGLTLVPRWKEHRALAGLSAPAAGAPNVLLLVLDTARGMNLSLNGYARPTTPGLERYARRGIRFEHAIAPSSWTLPSHASMFTGRDAGALSADWVTPLDHRYPTLAEVLTARGYQTGGFAANLNYCSRDYGLARGFLHYEDYSFKPGEFLLSSSLGRRLSKSQSVRNLLGRYDIPARKSAGDVTAALQRWIEGRKQGHPFFGFVNFFDGHQPYLPPAEYERKFASSVTPRPLWHIQRQGHFVHEAALGKRGLSPAEQQRELDAYDAALAYIDAEITRLLDTLATRGLLDSTVVIVTGDHGELFGEHNLYDHGNSLYRQLIEVPLLVLDPHAREARVIRQPVSLTDLAATVLDYAGPTGPALPGWSWRSLWSGDSLPLGRSRPVYSQMQLFQGKVWLSVVQDSLHYIRVEGGREELYDLGRDPQETNNVVAQPAYAAALAPLRAGLDSVQADSTTLHRFNEKPS